MKSVTRLFPLRWWLQVGALLAVLGGVFLWKAKACPLQTSTETLSNGLTLRKFAFDTPDGATQIYVVRGERKSSWRFDLGLAQGQVFQRETVTQIARRENAAVAVNGGFFAYEGAAIGAVKISGEWIRLPWKNRTAIAFKPDGTARVTNLRGAAKLTFAGELSGEPLEVANLNGNPIKDKISILTPRFGTLYKVKTGEIALEIEGGKVRKVVSIGTAQISEKGFVAVANGASQKLFTDGLVGHSAEWKVAVTPGASDDFPTILGAGPRLLRNGKAEEASREEEFRPDVLRRGPRTAVGTDANGDPLIVVADGHTDCSPGLTLPELAALMETLGATQALHMDCGPSSVLVINGKVANRPSASQPSGLKEPTVPNAVLIKQQPYRPPQMTVKTENVCKVYP